MAGIFLSGLFVFLFFLGRGFWGMDRFHCHATKK